MSVVPVRHARWRFQRYPDPRGGLARPPAKPSAPEGLAMRPLSRRRSVGLLAISAVAVLGACGESGAAATAEKSEDEDDGVIYSTVRPRTDQHMLLTEADAGSVIETDLFVVSILDPNKKGTEIELTGDDDSSLRWRFATKPDPTVVEWVKVDGQDAFETDGLIGDPATAAKLLEFYGIGAGETSLLLELVEMDPAKRTGEPAKRLEYAFSLTGLTNLYTPRPYGERYK